MPEEQAILDALSQIIDPDFQRDIVSLGFIKELTISGDAVAFSIELTTPACPIKDRFHEEAVRLVSALPGVSQVNVTMTARERPKRQLEEGSGLDKVGTIIAISSCKGGVGKSTVAAMLARNLAARGYRTGLLDTDLFGPSVPTLFNLHQEGVAGRGDYMLPVESDGLKIMSFGFMIGDKPAVMRGPMVANYMQHLLHHVAWDELDYLVIDLPPGTGDIQLTLSQKASVSGAVIVTTPQDIALLDAQKGIEMFRKVDVPILGIVENMAVHICTACGHQEHIFGEHGGARIAQDYGVPLLASLPLALSIRQQTDAGTPTVLAEPDSAISALYMQAAAAVQAALAGQADDVVRQFPEITISDD